MFHGSSKELLILKKLERVKFQALNCMLMSSPTVNHERRVFIELFCSELSSTVTCQKSEE